MHMKLFEGCHFELDDGAIFKKNKEGGIVIVRLDESDSFFLVSSEAAPLFEALLAGPGPVLNHTDNQLILAFVTKLLAHNLITIKAGTAPVGETSDCSWISEFNLNDYAQVENLSLGVYAGN